ncbi:hypothetical protein GFS60_02137 [Rhodococcus sp. WAY2]|nr:hypothetical protein GFS60_02137 [Rhodococcus sp. WAY2]
MSAELCVDSLFVHPWCDDMFRQVLHLAVSQRQPAQIH